IIKLISYHSQGMSKAKVRGMPQSEVSGKSTATAECEARAARRLSRRRREIFWRKYLWRKPGGKSLRGFHSEKNRQNGNTVA
ncbi:MAG: hypothetical protein IJY46_07835, partial [Lentisphaeria bacterium]|nr:hypothetical protein [Lentisphaeria bacterium]